MNWLKELPALNPFAAGMLILATFSVAYSMLAPKNAGNAEKAATAGGLKRISLNQLGRYLNKTSCSCLQAMFDGSRFNFPSIGDIFTGNHDNFIVTIFTFVLPTGRSGTWQTVIHLRSAVPAWLPLFSIVDEVSGKKLSDILKCEHTRLNPLINPNYSNRHKEADQLRASLARKPVNELSIAALKSPLRGIVLDSTGEDLFFYRHGETIESNEFKGYIEQAIKLWRMIESGNIDMNVFEKSNHQRSSARKSCRHHLLFWQPF
jgi:hypothetical protein